MEKKNITILIVAGSILILSLAFAYFFAMPAYKQIGQQESAIGQINAQIDAKKNYYKVIDSKVKALEDAGWAEKEQSIEVNFTSSPFFIAKMNSFFQTMASGSGMTLSGMTSSAPVSVKTSAASQSGSGGDVKISKDTSTTQETQQPKATTYFDQLQGPVNKTTFNLSLTGSYDSFKKFLSDMEGQTRIATVKSISVSSSQQGEGKKTVSISVFNLVVDVYSY